MGKSTISTGPAIFKFANCKRLPEGKFHKSLLITIKSHENPRGYRLGIVKIPASKHVEPQDSPSAPGPVARLSIHHDASRGGPRQRNAPHGRRHRCHRGILPLAVLGREKTWENIGKNMGKYENMGKTMGKYGTCSWCLMEIGKSAKHLTLGKSKHCWDIPKLHGHLNRNVLHKCSKFLEKGPKIDIYLFFTPKKSGYKVQ